MTVARRNHLQQNGLWLQSAIPLGLARPLHALLPVSRGRPPPFLSGGCNMSWTKPEFEVVELGMEVGAYAGNA